MDALKHHCVLRNRIQYQFNANDIYKVSQNSCSVSFSALGSCNRTKERRKQTKKLDDFVVDYHFIGMALELFKLRVIIQLVCLCWCDHAHIEKRAELETEPGFQCDGKAEKFEAGFSLLMRPCAKRHRRSA